MSIPQVASPRPAYDLATERIEHHGQIEKAGSGRDVAAIRKPQAIGRAATVKLRSIRSDAGRASRSRTLVIIQLRRPTPKSPAAPTSRATRLHPTQTPCSRSSAWIRGTP